ncbi:putative fatty acyl-CoA reductase CG8306 [Trichonephila clavata]|uniref:Fatty acyl-CoA reductase n=1 Tax=Trichonephila clavata TaxID=2740835 RepID=A0A8X6M2V7_TRICU|nr:putative fatty acyl-CoA reductase CG8306 [Trichonephila clavata]
MVVEDTVPKQTSEQWEDLTQLLDKFQNIFSQNKYDVLLESLLRIFSGIQSVYILLRPKKGVSPQERKKEILSRTIFNELRKANPNVFEKIHVVEGDVSLPNMGMSEEDLLKITEHVTIVFHCAASINFFKPFRYIFTNNVVGVNNAIELCKKLKNRCQALVDTSTSYVNCNHDLILEERIYGTPYPAERFMEYYEKEDDKALEQLRSEIKPDFPNHYVFCKYISENLILEKCTDIPSAIIRPSLISSAWKGPLPGYAEIQSSMAQFTLGVSKGFVKVAFADPEGNLEIIPVDIVVNAHIVAAYSVSIGR